MKKLFSSAVLAVAMGCGIEQQEELDQGGTASTAVSQAALCTCAPTPQAPQLPAQTDFYVLIRKQNGRLFGATAKGICTVVMQDPTNALRFTAVAYDVESQKALFNVVAPIKGGFRDFSESLADNVEAASSIDLGFSSRMTSMTGKKPIGGGGGGNPWDVCFKQFQIEL